MKSIWEVIKTWLLLNKGKAIGGGIGLLIAVLMISIGFWRTMLIVLLVSLGASVGAQVDDREKLNRWLERFWRKGKE